MMIDVLLLLAAPAVAAPSLSGGDEAWAPFHTGTLSWSSDAAALTLVRNGVVPAALSSLPPGPYPTAPLRVTIDPEPLFGDPDVVVEVCEGLTCHDVTLGYNDVTGDILHPYGAPTWVSAEDVNGVLWTGTVKVEWLLGHQQEAYGTLVVDDLTQAECDSGDYRVFGNGQPLEMGWCSADNACRAWAGAPPPALSCSGGSTAHGVYFPWQGGDDLSGQPLYDHYLWRTWYPWVDFADGELPTANYFTTWSQQALPYGGAYFNPSGIDLLVRPLLFELASIDPVTGDETVVDRSRVLYYDERYDTFAWFGALKFVPGAYAQLTPYGLDELEQPHVEVLPYPSADGFDTRLSDRALLEPWTSWGTFGGNATYELTTDDTYWTEPNPDGSGVEWQGHLAYAEILELAQDEHQAYLDDMLTCGTDLACQAVAAAEHCVKWPPGPADFKVVVNGIETRFDHAQPLPMTSGLASSVDLSFLDTDAIAAHVEVADVHAEIEGDLLLFTKVAFEVGPENACVPVVGVTHPSARWLEDFDAGAVDRDDWLTCPAMDLHATSAEGDLEFGVSRSGEAIAVAPGTGAFQLPVVTVDTSDGGTCAETWIADEVAPEVEAWAPTAETVFTGAWLETPSQEEALERLLSPLDLGIEDVLASPSPSLPYEVYPFEYMTLGAPINAAAADTIFFGTHSVHGLYAPYLTNVQPTVSVPSGWQWPCLRLGTDCGAPWAHDDALTSGTDPDGLPFDVSLDVRPEYINQVLWAQTPHADMLGQLGAPHLLAMGPTELHDAAAAQGLTEATAFLAGYPGGLEIELYATTSPYVWLPDVDPYQITLLAPNVVVELQDAVSGDLVARFVLDVWDEDLSLKWGGVADKTLLPALSKPQSTLTTVTLPNGCEGALRSELAASGTCEGELASLVDAEVVAYVEATLLDMLRALPAPKVWDTAGESTTLRLLTNRRYDRNGEGVRFLVDLK